MIHTMDVLGLSEAVLERAHRLGATDGEVYLNVSTGQRITLEVGSWRDVHVHRTRQQGMGLRLSAAGRWVHGSTTRLSHTGIEDIVARTLAAAAAASPRPGLDLPWPSADPPDPPIYDSDFAFRNVRTKIEALEALEHAARDSGATLEVLTYEDHVGQTCITNTHGLVARYAWTSYSVFLRVLIQQDGHRCTGEAAAYSRRSQDVLQRTLVDGAVRRAWAGTGQCRLRSGRYPVVFDGHTGAQWVMLLSGLFFADEEGATAGELHRQLGERIASSAVTLVDDGRLPWGPGSRPVDDEGTLSQRTLVVSAGTLRHLLCDGEAARRMGAISTGNAQRASHKTPPRVGVTNFHLAPGTADAAALAAGIAEGLLVLGLLNPALDRTTGRFRASATGLWIKEGAVDRPVTPVILSSNVTAMLSGIDLVGTDLAFHLPGWGAPSFRVAEMDIMAA